MRPKFAPPKLLLVYIVEFRQVLILRVYIKVVAGIFESIFITALSAALVLPFQRLEKSKSLLYIIHTFTRNIESYRKKIIIEKFMSQIINASYLICKFKIILNGLLQQQRMMIQMLRNICK